MSNTTKSEARRSFLHTLARAEKAFSPREGHRITLKSRLPLITALNRRSVTNAVVNGLPTAFGFVHNGMPQSVTEARKILRMIRNHLNSVCDQNPEGE